MLAVFVINLDRSADRLAHIQSEFARIGLDFERFPAVNGTDLPDNLKPYFCDASGRIVSPLKPGEIGCYASHLAVWQLIIERGLPSALVCEDDVELSHDLPELLASALDAAARRWDVIRLVDESRVGAHRTLTVVQLSGEHRLIRYWKHPMLAGAYLVSRDGAAKLCKPFTRRNGIDGDLRQPWLFGAEHYGIYPPPVRQRHHMPSEIGRERGCTIAISARTPPLVRARQHLYNIRSIGVTNWLRLSYRQAP